MLVGLCERMGDVQGKGMGRKEGGLDRTGCKRGQSCVKWGWWVRLSDHASVLGADCWGQMSISSPNGVCVRGAGVHCQTLS